MTTAHDFTLNDLVTGADVPLAALRDRVVLLVNVASQCGYTPQYGALEAVFRHYMDADFVVVGVPCNQFGGQEPGSSEEIQQFCSATFDVTFPLVKKIEVNGAGAHPLYKWLTDDGKHPIEWNFEKFLINKDGTVAARFAPGLSPDEPEVLGAIEKAIDPDRVEPPPPPDEVEG
ncbi:MAG TPA: glutathione peroxidase [Myxococcota bacterium]